MPVSSIQLGGVELNDSTLGIAVTSANYYSSPMKKVNEHEVAQTDGAVSTFQKFAAKTIEINGWISTDTLATFIAKVDQIKRQQAQYGSPLVITEANITRTYEDVIVTQFDIDKGSAPNFALYSMTLWSASPYAYGPPINAPDATLTSAGSQATEPTADYTFRLPNPATSGSADILPLFRFGFTTTASINLNQPLIRLYFYNPANDNQRLIFDYDPRSAYTLNANFAGTPFGSPYIIDCEDGSVKRNGDNIYVQGSFPYWTAGSDSFILRVKGTANFSWSITIGATYRLRYL